MAADNPIWWNGPICGLGNRILALAAVRACAGDRPVRFYWSNDDSCPGEFEDIFVASDSFAPAETAPPEAMRIETGWEPYEIFETFKGALDFSMSRAQFSARFLEALNALPFLAKHVETARSWREAEGAAPLVGVHVRRTDRTAQHRQQFQNFLTLKSGLNRELPVWLSALYGLAPHACLRVFENAMLTSALRRYGSAQGDYSYVVFADNEDEALNLERAAARSAPKGKLIKGPCYESVRDLEKLRRTSIASAIVDLLCLSQCEAIAQGNRASSFSLVAAIFGRKPILTAKTHHPFWRMLEEDLGVEPNALPFTTQAD